MKRSICLALIVLFVFSLLLCGCKRGLEEDETKDGVTTPTTSGTTDVTGTENETIPPGTVNEPTSDQSTMTGQEQPAA